MKNKKEIEDLFTALLKEISALKAGIRNLERKQETYSIMQTILQ